MDNKERADTANRWADYQEYLESDPEADERAAAAKRWERYQIQTLGALKDLFAEVERLRKFEELARETGIFTES